jgi:hypothetical protein
VLDYLVVEGYRDAAEEFLRETSVRGSVDAASSGAGGSSDGDLSSDDDEDDAMAGSGSLGAAFDASSDKPDLSGIEVSRRLFSLTCPACPLAVPVLNEPFCFHMVPVRRESRSRPRPSPTRRSECSSARRSKVGRLTSRSDTSTSWTPRCVHASADLTHLRPT